MQVQLEVEIDSKGIIGQMEKVRNAEIKMRQEMDKLNEMVQTASAKETGNSEESPAKEIVIDGAIVSELVQKAIHDTISKDVASLKNSEQR